MAVEDWQHAGFGLYVHWPFCQSKCPYCDFNSHVVDRVDQTAWADALVADVRRIGAELGPRPLSSIFFGGGTPSLMPPATVAAVIDAATDVFSPSNALEITLEANPSSVEAERFKGYRTAGVNRVSLGVQALNDPDLRALGRLHSVAEARAAIDLAKSTFARVSFDLIYARQHQSLSDWDTELTEAVNFGTDHLSLYQLTVEPGTAFGARHARGGLGGLPGEDLSADMYALTQSVCDAAGMPAYEISNHARPGAECIHNKIYWQSGDYAGVGPGAHGRLTLNGARFATEAPRDPATWLRAANIQAAETRKAIPDDARLEEAVMMGLRTTQGIDLNRINTGSLSRIDALCADGWLVACNGRLAATSAGRPVLNEILRQLLA
ncbi:MAG: radical SAM family heme chaperone HemW [Pseudomonadota bacterium]